MFYYLHTLASGWLGFFSVFRSVTFRAAFAAVTAFLLCIFLGPRFIAWLKAKRIKDTVDERTGDLAKRPANPKAGTPTMGGVLLIGSTLIAVALFTRPDVFSVLAFFTMLALMGVGLLDDWIKLTEGRKDGLSKNEKLGFQFLVGLGVATTLMLYSDERYATTLAIPFLQAAQWPVLGYFYIAWGGVVLVGTSNAVNLTDGLDGLATLCSITVTVAFGLLAYFAGHAGMAEHLGVPRVRGAEELAVICSALSGSCLGFLWYNSYPAEVFMGDTGSLPLGGLIGLVALCIKQELLLLVIGGIFVMEALSVLIQVWSYKLRGGKRVFLMAPIHHHFQKLGWAETKVVQRFFIVSVLLAVFSIALLRLH